MIGWPALVVCAYLIGSISFSLLVVQLLRRVDLRTVGSGNPGATNVLRAAGRWPALAVLMLDIAKGLLPVQLAKRLEASPTVVAGVALAAVLGHVYPIYFGFRGGKGVATGLGAYLGLFPLAAGAAIVVWIVVVLVSRYVSLASLVGAAVMPFAAWGIGRLGWSSVPQPSALVLATAMCVVILARHRSNLRRLIAGDERRLGGGVA